MNFKCNLSSFFILFVGFIIISVSACRKRAEPKPTTEETLERAIQQIRNQVIVIAPQVAPPDVHVEGAKERKGGMGGSR